jgi:hypothetical protein
MLLNKLRRPITVRFYTTNNTTNNTKKELLGMNIKLMEQNTKLLKELESIKQPILKEPVKNECAPDTLESIICTGITVALYSILLVMVLLAMYDFMHNNNTVMSFLCFVLFMCMLMPTLA